MKHINSNVIMKTFRYVTIMILSVLLLASCKKSGYVNCIPSDATLVVSVDFNELATKADLRNSHLNEIVDQYLGLVVFGEGLDKAKEYIDKPETIGIDFREPAYFFRTAGGEFGATLCVHDESALTEFINVLVKQDICTKPSEKNGYQTGTMLDDIHYGYDGSTLLLVASLEGGRSRQMLNSFMNQNDNNSFSSTDNFGKMVEMKDKDIILYSNLGVLGNDVKQMFSSVIPQGVHPADVEFFGSVAFENGVARLTAEFEGANDKTKEMLDDIDKNFYKITGEVAEDVLLDKTLIWGNIGVNGEWLLDKMKKSKELKQMLFVIERAVDVEAMIRSIDGDVSIAAPLSILEDQEGVPDFSLKAHLKSTSFLNDVKDWMEAQKDYGIVMINTAPDEYVFEYQHKPVIWAVNKKVLTMASYTYYTKDDTYYSEYLEQIPNYSVFFLINLQTLPLKEKAGLPDFLGFNEKIDKLKSFIIKASSAHEWEVDIELTDKEQNFLNALI